MFISCRVTSYLLSVWYPFSLKSLMFPKLENKLPCFTLRRQNLQNLAGMQEGQLPEVCSWGGDLRIQLLCTQVPLSHHFSIPVNPQIQRYLMLSVPEPSLESANYCTRVSFLVTSQNVVAFRGTWGAQLVKHPTLLLAKIMMSGS